jgi:hypothetical protein
VVTNLQQVHGRDEAASHERRLDRGLGIPGQQGAEPAVPHQQHDGAVVDVALRKRRRRIGPGRIQHLHGRRAVQGERLAGYQCADGDRIGERVRQEAVIRGVLERDAGMQDRSNAEPIEGVDEAGHVILVRMAEREDVDPSRPERQIGAQAAKGELRVRTAIHQHRRAGRCLEQDGVALADVEHRHVKATVRTAGQGDPSQHQHEASEGGQRADEPGQGGHRAGHRLVGDATRRIGGWAIRAERPAAEREQREPCDGERRWH